MRLLAAVLPILALPMLAAPVPAQAGGMSYAPGVSQYEITSVLRQERDVMGEKQESEVTTTQLLTVQIERSSTDTMRFQLVIDSVHVSAETPVDIQGVVGVPLTGTMSPRGKVYDLQPPAERAEDSDMQAVLISLRNFLVGLPASTRAGASWTDTTDTNIATDEMDVMRRVITHSTLAGDTSYAGQRAQRIRQNMDLSLSGTASSQGFSVVMAGAGKGTAIYYVTSAGVYLGSSSEQQTTLELSVGDMKMPITQTMTASVRKVR